MFEEPTGEWSLCVVIQDGEIRACSYLLTEPEAAGPGPSVPAIGPAASRASVSKTFGCARGILPTQCVGGPYIVDEASG